MERVVTELIGRGGVLRCRDDESGLDIAIKVIRSETNGPETEYSALQYLAEHAPDFPAPKPHGFLKLGEYRFILMSYIPSTTLRSVWSTLSHDNKLSIQLQLDQLFARLREIKQPKGGRLGGAGGEGVHDMHAWVEHNNSETIMTTATEFRDFQFSIKAVCDDELAVFTHGDLFLGNIMVDKDPTKPGEYYLVSGIIDWETSGFYPPSFEASKILYTFNENGRADLQDWWKYVPSCISPASYPAEWAVGRLWDMALGAYAW
ncbi:Protein kinase-like domain containing protein [Rhypophila sp. PSN 637]